MATQGFVWRKCLDGGTPEIVIREADGTIKQGDAVKLDATRQNVIAVTAKNDVVFGVATHDAVDGEDVNIIPARMNNIFEVATGTTAFTVGTHESLTAEIGVFTPGSMTVKCAGTAKQFYTIELADGETSAETANKVLGFFPRNNWDVASST